MINVRTRGFIRQTLSGTSDLVCGRGSGCHGDWFTPMSTAKQAGRRRRRFDMNTPTVKVASLDPRP